MMKAVLIFSVVVLQMQNALANEIFGEISTKTWFESTNFAGASIVFVKTEVGETKAIRQIHGSGVYVVSTEVYNVEIKGDTVHLINGFTAQTNDKRKNQYFIYNGQLGLLKKGKPLTVFANEPVIYVWGAKSIMADKRVSLNAPTKILFETNEVIIDGELFKFR